MVDYTSLLATAQRLIDENGRDVTFIELDADPASASEPWKGATDPRATPDSTLAAKAVFVEPSSAVRLGLASAEDDLVKRSDKIMIVSAGASVDLNTFDEVIDETLRWKITEVQVLRPATVTVVSFVGVRR